MNLGKQFLNLFLTLAIGLTATGLRAEEPERLSETKQLYIYFGDKAMQYDETKTTNPHWNLEILDIDPASAEQFKWMLGTGGKKDLPDPSGKIKVELKNDEPNSYLPGNKPSQVISSKQFNDNSVMLSPKTYYYISFSSADPVKGKYAWSSSTVPLFNHTFMLFKKEIGGFVFYAREIMENGKRVFKLECLGQCEWVNGTTYRLCKWDGAASSKKTTNSIFLYQSDRNSTIADYSDMKGKSLSITKTN